MDAPVNSDYRLVVSSGVILIKKKQTPGIARRTTMNRGGEQISQEKKYFRRSERKLQ